MVFQSKNLIQILVGNNIKLVQMAINHLKHRKYSQLRPDDHASPRTPHYWHNAKTAKTAVTAEMFFFSIAIVELFIKQKMIFPKKRLILYTDAWKIKKSR